MSEQKGLNILSKLDDDSGAFFLPESDKVVFVFLVIAQRE